MDLLTIVILTVLAGIVFDFVNGRCDSANAIATVISTRALTPLQALFYAAILNFIGALVSTKVAMTMCSGVVHLPLQMCSIVTVLAAMIASAAWVTWCTGLGLPVSSSHALVGSLVGATAIIGGWSRVQWTGVTKILVALLVSPLLGFVLGLIAIILATWLAHVMEATPRQGRKAFGFLQIVSSGFMAFEHGKNDAQKVMGVVALALFVGGFLKDGSGQTIRDVGGLYIPMWVRLVCGVAMALGTVMGGWRVIRTLGSKLAKITKLEGCAAETAAGVVLELAASLGIPVSTTHTLTGSVVGVGSAKGVRAVKWGLGAKIVWAWVFTLPVCFVLGGALSWFAAWTSPQAMVAAVAAVTATTWAWSLVRDRLRRGPRGPGVPPSGQGTARAPSGTSEVAGVR